MATPLHEVAQAGDVAAILALLAAGAAVGSADKHGKTPLHMAAYNGHIGAIRTLLSAGAAVDSVEKDAWTPLHLAAENGHVDAIHALLAAGAAVNSTGKDEWTPLHKAVQNGHSGAIRTLVGAGAAVESMGKNEYTPLHLAAYTDHTDAIRVLLAAGAAVESVGTNEWTPLHLAAYNGHIDAIRALLSGGAAVDSVEKDAWTPLHLAAQNGHSGAIRALVGAEAAVDSKTSLGSTPLHLAARGGHVDAIRALVDAGASLTSKNKAGQVPVEIARGVNHAEASRALQEAAEVEQRRRAAEAAAAEQRRWRKVKAAAAEEAWLQTAVSRETQKVQLWQEAHRQLPEELALLRVSADQPRPDLKSALEAPSSAKGGAAAMGTAPNRLMHPVVFPAPVQGRAAGTNINAPVYSEADWRGSEAKAAVAEEARLRAAVSREVERLQEQQQLKEQEAQRQLVALQEEVARLKASAYQPRPVPPEIPISLRTPSSKLDTGLASCEVTESEVVLMEKLGQGSFGEVWRGQWYGSDVAVKKLRAETAGALPAEVLASLRQESALMASLRHDRIVGLRGVCFDPPLIVMELCGRQALDTVLQAAQSDLLAAQKLTWPRRLGILVDVAWGMTYLHSRHVLHRDLKSPNILVDDNWRAKVADFNLSKLMEIRVGSAAASSRARSTYSSINPRWLAPELVLEGDDGTHAYATPSSDCFAFGLVMWEVLAWQYPWANLNETQIVGRLYQHRRPPIPDRSQLPGPNSGSWVGLDSFISLMKRCWDDDPAARPSFITVATELQALLG